MHHIFLKKWTLFISAYIGYQSSCRKGHKINYQPSFDPNTLPVLRFPTLENTVKEPNLFLILSTLLHILSISKLIPFLKNIFILNKFETLCKISSNAGFLTWSLPCLQSDSSSIHESHLVWLDETNKEVSLRNQSLFIHPITRKYISVLKYSILMCSINKKTNMVFCLNWFSCWGSQTFAACEMNPCLLS